MLIKRQQFLNIGWTGFCHHMSPQSTRYGLLSLTLLPCVKTCIAFLRVSLSLPRHAVSDLSPATGVSINTLPKQTPTLRRKQTTPDEIDSKKTKEKSSSSPLLLIAKMESDQLRLIGEECGEKFGKLARKKSLDVESGESSTDEVEVESPRSVVVKKKLEWVHSQVLRIREEESHLGEDFLSGLEGLRGKYIKTAVVGGSPKRHRVNVVVLSRPILPCSPLSGKNTVKALH